MSKAQVNKAKGRNGQKEIADMLLSVASARGYAVTEDDFVSTPMGSQGADVMMSSIGKKIFPWNIEIKRSRATTIERWMEQAREHGKLKPVVFSREDRKEWLVTVDLEYFLELFSNVLDKQVVGIK